MTTTATQQKIESQYAACMHRGGFLERKDRGLIEVTGTDRAAFLHNLTTNQVKNLSAGEGNYVFAINVKGRTVFDAHLLVTSESILLDLDRGWIETAMSWLDRYMIAEDVQFRDCSSEHARIAMLGKNGKDVVSDLGFGNLVPMAWYQHVSGEVSGTRTILFRHDFAGVIGCEFIMLGDDCTKAIQRIRTSATHFGLTEIDMATVDAMRIEAGIPRSIVDIDEEVIPPETGQIERGISYHKGCYLGQEVIERMRAHGILVRKLVGIRYETDAPRPNTPLSIDGETVGRSMSAAHSPALSSAVALGYVKSAKAKAGTTVSATVDGKVFNGELIELPIRQS